MRTVRAPEEPSFWTAELWCRALLLASLRDERADPFAPADVELLWELGLWPLPYPPALRPREQEDADAGFGHARS